MKYFYSYLSLLIIIIFFNALNSHSLSLKESFTPRIREMFRPYLRDTRIYTNNIYNKHKNNITNFLKKNEFI
jgi:hypothetical protein